MEIVHTAAISSHQTTSFPGPDSVRYGGTINQTKAGFADKFSPCQCRLNGLSLVTEVGKLRYARGRWQKNERWRVTAARSRKTEASKVQQVDEEKEKRGGSSLLTFLCPLLKLLGGGDPAAPRNVFLEVGQAVPVLVQSTLANCNGDKCKPWLFAIPKTATSGLASLSRLPWGSQVNAEVVAERATLGQPPQLLQLYEFEACPFCRRVREALTELDLSAEIYPCPKGSLKHREFVKTNGGREQFPYIIDPNTGVSLYESSEIVSYLFKEYGGGRKPSPGLLGSTLVTGWIPTLLRAGRGMMLYSQAASIPPPQKLELYNYENNQFARLVREALCELELPYILRNAGKGSPLRNSLLKIAGSTQVPYLVDPNTGISMAESKDIIAYLFETYASKN